MPKTTECFHSYKVNNAREYFSLECTKCGATWSDKIRAINHLIKEVDRAREETAWECYLECLAVECGDGECATAIKTKFNLQYDK